MTPTATYMELVSPVIKKFFPDNIFVQDFLWKSAYIMQVWDDVIDKTPVTDEEVNNAFKYALVDIPTNPFYLANVQRLGFQYKNIISKWLTANEFEKAPTEERLNKSFILRAEYYQLWVTCYEILHGWDEAVKMSVNMWDCYGESKEAFRGGIKCQN